MKDSQNASFCPGCKKHCPAHAPCCKFGRQYFEKHPILAQEKTYKWDAYTIKNGLLWQLFLLSKEIKQELKTGKTSEETILNRLTQDEQENLFSIIKKMQEK